MEVFKRMRTIVPLLLSVIIAVSISACGSGKDTLADGEKKIRIGYLTVMDDAQAILAYDAGLYTKHGLKVDMIEFASGTDLIKQIVGGELDAGVLGFTNALTWVAQGADLKVVGGAQMGFHSILVNKDSPIKKVEDLKGKKLASQKPGSTADVVLNGVVLADAELAKTDVEMVYVSPAAAIQSLAAGTVDAAFVFEPFDSIARAAFEADSIYEIGDVWPFPCMVVIASGDVLNKDRDIIDRMLNAQKEAIEMMRTDSAKAAGYITKRFISGDSVDTPTGKVSAVSVIKDSIDSQIFNYDLTPDDIKRMQEIADIMVEQGSLEKPIQVVDLLDLTWQQQSK